MLIVFLIRVLSHSWPQFSLWPEYSHVTSDQASWGEPRPVSGDQGSAWGCPLIGQTDTLLSSDWSRARVWSLAISLTPGQDGSLTTKPIAPTCVGLGRVCHPIIVTWYLCGFLTSCTNQTVDIKACWLFVLHPPSWHSNLYLFMRSALWSILLSPVMQMLHPVWNYNVGQNIWCCDARLML